jgi:putative FmdB family regulatory protein
MPTYVYQCPKCGRRAELEQSMTNRTAPMCCEESCNVEMETVIGVTSFVLKGSGWARDGYSGGRR